MRTTRKGRLLVAAVAAAFVLGLGATAWACIGLSTLSPGSSSPTPGQPLPVRGDGYASNGGDVSVHLDSPRGEVVAMVAPRNDGTFETTFTVPNLRGRHVLVAVQRDAHGTVTKTANSVIDVAGPAGFTPSGSSTDDLALAPPPNQPGFGLAGPLGLATLVLLAGSGALVWRRRSGGAAGPLSA